MLAERADEIVRQVALVDVSADLADPALLSLGRGLRLDVLLIVRIRHRVAVGDNARLFDAADEHPVRAEIDLVLDLERHERVDVFRQEA